MKHITKFGQLQASSMEEMRKGNLWVGMGVMVVGVNEDGGGEEGVHVSGCGGDGKAA